MTEAQISSTVTRAIGAQYDEFHTSLESLGPMGEEQKYLNYGFRASRGQSYEETQAQLCLEVFRAAEIGPADVIVDVCFGSS